MGHDLLIEEYEAHSAYAISNFYFKISAMPGAATLRGYLFEQQVLKYLDSIKSPCKLSMRRLTDSEQESQEPWPYRGSFQRVRFDKRNYIENSIVNDEPLHLVSSAPNFDAVDSTICDPKEVLTLIQTTINSTRPIAVKDLHRIQNWLKHRTQRQSLRPAQARPWRFIFIVPESMASTFTSQRLYEDTPGGIWAKNMNQYVLGLKEENIFALQQRKEQVQEMAIDD